MHKNSSLKQVTKLLSVLVLLYTAVCIPEQGATAQDTASKDTTEGVAGVDLELLVNGLTSPVALATPGTAAVQMIRIWGMFLIGITKIKGATDRM